MQKRFLMNGLVLGLFVMAPYARAQRPAHRVPAHRTRKPHSATQQMNQPAKPTQGEQSTPRVPAPPPSDEVSCTSPSCATFNRLIQAKDRTLTLNLYVPHAYACFDPQADRFQVVGYSISAVSLTENAEEVSDGWVSSDQYENDADVDSDMTLGQWHAVDSSPGVLKFQETSSSDNDSSFHVETNDSLFTFSRTYTTIQGNAVSIELKISLPSLQFSESYSTNGQAPTNTSGQCSKYGLDSHTPASFVSSNMQ